MGVCYIRFLFYAICMFVIIILLSSLRLSDKSFEKHQKDIWRLECKHGIISDTECPVDGGWTPWSTWSPCQGSCEDSGYTIRRRKCLNPPPSTDGAPCKGASEQSKQCFFTNCTIDDFRKIIHDDPVRRYSLKQLSLVPGIMERCLLMECPFEAIEVTLATDNTWQIEPEALWNSLLCVKRNTGCSSVGGWGVWGAWSPCGARCGRGIRCRIRKCDTPPPSQAQLICDDSPLQSEECEGDQCFIDEKELDDNTTWAWSNWGEWSSCSENCGPGVSRRTRTCYEKAQHNLEYWGTQCRGQHEQIEECKVEKCVLDGGWSGWSEWGPCSNTCGVGRRSRSRACTRPIPSNDGAPCVGPKMDVGPCHLGPCESYSHVVAVLNEDSSLVYELKNKQSVLFHFYLRFMPLSQHGTLVHRGDVDDPLVLLSMQKWRVCLDAHGLTDSCVIQRVCSDSIEPGTWHSVLITVTNHDVNLRIDDAPVPITATFNCNPEMPNDKINVVIGRKFRGEIQEAVLNFIPLEINLADKRTKKHSLYPTESSDVAFEKAGLEEGYLLLNNEQYLRLPCFDTTNEWSFSLTLRPQQETGSILFFKGEGSSNWFHMFIQNMRLKLKLVTDVLKCESISYTDLLPDQWYEITLSQQKDGDAIEAIINGDERVHILTSDTGDRLTNISSDSHIRHFSSRTSEESKMILKRNNKVRSKLQRHTLLCQDELFISGAPVPNIPSEEKTTLSGIIASMKINGVAQDLHELNMERQLDPGVQLSSRTASISDSYQELYWGTSNTLNMSCFNTRCPQPAYWIFLDSVIEGSVRNKPVRSVDDGGILKLITSTDNEMRGFYTCRTCGRNIVTYGVIGQLQKLLIGIDMTTKIAIGTTLTLTIGTILFLVAEGIQDLRNGFGFFRDAYIDDNAHLFDSMSKTELAKSRSRRRVTKSASTNFVQQLQRSRIVPDTIASADSSKDSTVSQPRDCPAILDNESSLEPAHTVYVCEPCYDSSPRHGSLLSSKAKITSSSTFEMTSRGMLSWQSAKRSSRESMLPKLGTKRKLPRFNMLTIQSSTMMTNTSPAHKVLQQFERLKKDDT